MILTGVLMFFSLLHAQRVDIQSKFFATTEEEMYSLFNQMLDTIRIERNCDEEILGNPLGFYHIMESKDTLIVFAQSCNWYGSDEYICNRFSYDSYMSNNMPIDYYKRFLDYLEKVESNSDDYYVKRCTYMPFFSIKEILVKRYESGKLNEQESAKTRSLIERTMLMSVNIVYSYSALIYYDKYMTDNIRKALIKKIKNPFYPTIYFDSYMSQHDTICIDTVGISDEIKRKHKNYSWSADEYKHIARLNKFYHYKNMGDYWGGLSPGQAYLKEKEDKFFEKGYLPINEIAEYAYRRKDELLIKHLKEFKKKHPDYPLEYF